MINPVFITRLVNMISFSIVLKITPFAFIIESIIQFLNIFSRQLNIKLFLYDLEEASASSLFFCQLIFYSMFI